MRQIALAVLVLCVAVTVVGCQAGHHVMAPSGVVVTSAAALPTDKPLGFVTGNSRGINLFMIFPIGGDFELCMAKVVEHAQALGATHVVDTAAEGWGGNGLNLTLGGRTFYIRGMAVKR